VETLWFAEVVRNVFYLWKTSFAGGHLDDSLPGTRESTKEKLSKMRKFTQLFADASGITPSRDDFPIF
jgi:hypothetical protein